MPGQMKSNPRVYLVSKRQTNYIIKLFIACPIFYITHIKNMSLSLYLMYVEVFRGLRFQAVPTEFKGDFYSEVHTH